MTFGIHTFCWESQLTTEKLERLTPKITDAGFDMIELPLEDHDAIAYDRAARILEDAGLDASVCAVMTPERDLLRTAESRETGKEYLRRCISAAETIGARNVVGPMYAAVGRTWYASSTEREQIMDQLVADLGELAEFAGDRDVVLCVEILNRFETSVFNTVEQGIELIDRIDQSSCGLLLDTFHMNIEEADLGDAIRNTGSHLEHFHVCSNSRGAPGSGHLDWEPIVDALDDIQYTGPVVIETFNSRDDRIAERTSLWRVTADDQDDVAQDGLSFLQHRF